MSGKFREWTVVAMFVEVSAFCFTQLRADETTTPAATPAAATANQPAADSAPASGGIQREYARLAQLLNSSDTFGKQEAADTFLRVRPSDVPDPNTRKLIARGYRSLALDGNSLQTDTAVKGLVIWAGKYSVPVLIELSEKNENRISDAVFTALGQLKDPRGAEAVARHLGNFFNHDAAVASLRRMGPAAEDALIKAAPSSDAKVSLAAIQLLGEVGTDKSTPLLQKASAARNPQVKQVARDAMKQIRARQKGGAPTEQKTEDADSPFAEGAGPAIDITARNSRDYAERQARATTGVGAGSPAGTGDSEPPSDRNEGDWSHVQALLPGDAAGAGVPADPAKDSLDSNWKPQPVRLGKTTSAHERPTSMYVAGGKSPAAAVVFSDPFNKSIGRLEFVDLKARRSVASSNVMGGTSYVYLSPSGKRLLIAAQEETGDRLERLNAYSLNGGRPVEEAVWWPYATSNDHWAGQIKWLNWIDDEQFLAFNGQGMVVLWRMDGKTPKAIYQLDADSNSTPALSAGRAHLALATSRGVEIFRASDGTLLARMSKPSGSCRLAFNASGERLAGISGGNISVWDTSNGKLLRDFYCNVQNPVGAEWLDDQHLAVGDTDIVDIDHRLIAWRYEANPLTSASYGGWSWMLMRSGAALGIVPVKLLHPELLEVTKGLDPEQILAIKPGAKIALDIQLGGDEQTKAEATLRKALEQNGMEVVADSPIRIRAQIVMGKSETKKYGEHAFSQETQDVTTTEKLFEVELTVDGQSVWKQRSVMQWAGGPGIVMTKEGETAQQAVDRENAERSKNFGFGVTLPRYVVQPKYAGPLGTSKLSIGGQ
jgi:hypothetical protein